MEQKKKTWLVVAIVLVILILVFVFSEKGEKPTEEEQLSGEYEQDLKDMESAPEVKEGSEPVEVAPEASKVDQGIVVDDEGEPVKTDDVGPGSEGSPKQSKILEEEEKEQVSENAINLEVSRENGFTPSSFKVKPGQAVTILLTATDNQKHILRFKDSSLRSVAITVKDGQSKATTFNAPTRQGVYEFICSDPGHDGTGQMFVTND